MLKSHKMLSSVMRCCFHALTANIWNAASSLVSSMYRRQRLSSLLRMVLAVPITLPHLSNSASSMRMFSTPSSSSSAPPSLLDCLFCREFEFQLVAVSIELELSRVERNPIVLNRPVEVVVRTSPSFLQLADRINNVKIDCIG